MDRTNEFIKLMREQGAHYNVREAFFGEVVSASPLKVKFSDLTIKEKMFAKSQAFLDHQEIYKHFGKQYIKKGDTLLIVYLKELDKYVIMDKVVV